MGALPVAENAAMSDDLLRLVPWGIGLILAVAGFYWIYRITHEEV